MQIQYLNERLFLRGADNFELLLQYLYLSRLQTVGEIFKKIGHISQKLPIKRCFPAFGTPQLQRCPWGTRRIFQNF